MIHKACVLETRATIARTRKIIEKTKTLAERGHKISGFDRYTPEEVRRILRAYFPSARPSQHT